MIMKIFYYIIFIILINWGSSIKAQEQYITLKKEFNEWKGSREQIDDVCVMGVRII